MYATEKTDRRFKCGCLRDCRASKRRLAFLNYLTHVGQHTPKAMIRRQLVNKICHQLHARRHRIMEIGSW